VDGIRVKHPQDVGPRQKTGVARIIAIKTDGPRDNIKFVELVGAIREGFGK
jgi:hypothetical protein